MWYFVQFVYCFCTKCTIVCVVFVVFYKKVIVSMLAKNFSILLFLLYIFRYKQH